MGTVSSYLYNLLYFVTYLRNDPIIKKEVSLYLGVQMYESTNKIILVWIDQTLGRFQKGK